MAIDYNAGINSIDVGAHDITYSGNEGPKSPEQERQMAFDDTPIFEMRSLDVLIDEFKDDNNGEGPKSIDDLRRFFYNKYGPDGIAKVEQAVQQQEQAQAVQQQAEGIQMAAQGGRAGYANGQLVQPGPGRPGYRGSDWSPDAKVESVERPGSADNRREQADNRREQYAVTGNIEEPYVMHDKQKVPQSIWGTGVDPREKEDVVEEKEKFKLPSLWGMGIEAAKKFAAWNNMKQRQNFISSLTDEEREALEEQLGAGFLTDQTGESLVDADNLNILNQFGYQDYLNRFQQPDTGGDDQGITSQYPYPYPYQTASAPVDETETAEWTAPHIPTWEDEKLTLYSADGGRVPAAYGGIMGDDGRRAYGLGSMFKKAARGIKKLVKSPIGKAALLGLGGAWLGGTSAFGGSGMGWGSIGNLLKPSGWSKKNIIGNLLTKGWDKKNEQWKGFDPWKLGIMGAAAYPLIAGMGKEDDDFTDTDLYKKWLAQKQGWDKTFAPVGDPANFQPIRFADGGRTGYAKGGDDDEEEDHRSAALSAMYGLRKNAQEGGLMDMGGMEKDYRNEGGFVPIGGQERADDVPARLSKNEFVFTADAVRAAGGGDIDKGAEVMENVMENLEKGGNVSEESQGLEGARNMFATSQRLEGVL